MSKYYCVVCEYDAKQKSNYDKHMNTKRHKELSTKVIQMLSKVIQMLSKVIQMLSKIIRTKRNIGVNIVIKDKYRSGLSKHIKSVRKTLMKISKNLRAC